MSAPRGTSAQCALRLTQAQQEKWDDIMQIVRNMDNNLEPYETAITTSVFEGADEVTIEQEVLGPVVHYVSDAQLLSAAIKDLERSGVAF